MADKEKELKPVKKTVKKKTAKAKKTPAKTASKKTVKKTASDTGKKAASLGTKKEYQQKSDNNAFFVLVIMGLVTVIVLLLNNYYAGSGKKTSKNKNEYSYSLKKAEKHLPLKNNKKNVKIPKKNIKIRTPEKKNIIPESGLTSIKIYYIKLNEKSGKIYLSTVKRKVRKESVLASALNHLVRGPSLVEENKGYATALPKNIKIKKVKISNRTAIIDFNSAIEKNATGNIMISRLDQIIYTATQFNNIDCVIIKINGKFKNSIGPDGLSIRGPMHRRN